MPWSSASTTTGLFDASLPAVAIFKPCSAAARNETLVQRRAARCRKLIAKMPQTTVAVLRDVYAAAGGEEAPLGERAAVRALRDGFAALALGKSMSWTDEVVERVLKKTDPSGATDEYGGLEHFLAASAQALRTVEKAAAAARPHSYDRSGRQARSSRPLPVRMRGVAGVQQLMGALASGTRTLFGYNIVDIDTMFGAMDRDQNGVIDWPELEAALARLDIVVEGETFENLVNAIDVNGDGIITLVEFRRALAWLERTETSAAAANGARRKKKKKKKTKTRRAKGAKQKRAAGASRIGRDLGLGSRRIATQRRPQPPRRAAKPLEQEQQPPPQQPPPRREEEPRSPPHAATAAPAPQPQLPPELALQPALQQTWLPTPQPRASLGPSPRSGDDPVLGALRSLLAQQGNGELASKESNQRALKEALREMYAQHAPSGARLASAAATARGASPVACGRGGDRAAEFGTMLNTIVRQLVGGAIPASVAANGAARAPLSPLSTEQQRRPAPRAAKRLVASVPRLERFNGVVTRGQIDAVVTLLIDEMMLAEASALAAKRKLGEVVAESDARRAVLDKALAAIAAEEEAEGTARACLAERAAIAEKHAEEVEATRRAAEAAAATETPFALRTKARLAAPDAERAAVLRRDAESYAEYRALAEEAINPSGTGRAQWELVELYVCSLVLFRRSPIADARTQLALPYDHQSHTLAFLSLSSAPFLPSPLVSKG